MKKGDLIEMIVDSPYSRTSGNKGDIGQLCTIISHSPGHPELAIWIVLCGTVYHTLYDDEFEVVASS